MNIISDYIADLKREFKGYNGTKLKNDLMAGFTVTAVALPLALAFGVSSGASAAAGLITAIIAGLIIGALSGASYQISGPTGAMSAVLISIAIKFGLQGIFVVSLIAGVVLIIAGLFKFGKIVGLIPAPVITGFTSGIAALIILGQINNFFGVHSEGETAIENLLSYGQLGFDPNMQAVIIGLIVIAIMAFCPKKINEKFPSSLIAIIVAGVIATVFHFDVATVGSIPRSLFPEDRLVLSAINLDMINNLIAPALTIAALAMIESLLCGVSLSKTKGEPFNSDRELVAQGIGNMIVPFFGGVPASAAIARSSVGVKAGGQTRLTGIFHAIGLLICMFLLGDVMAKLPLAALAGVLIMTAVRMNDWSYIKYMFKHKFKGAILKYGVTLVTTVMFDLTMAIIAGFGFAIFNFVVNASNIDVNYAKVDNERLKDRTTDIEALNKNTTVCYITGPIFFGTQEKFQTLIKEVFNYDRVIISMRGVTTMDATGEQILFETCKELRKQGKTVEFSGVQPRIMEFFVQAEFDKFIGEDNFFFSVDKALLRAQ